MKIDKVYISCCKKDFYLTRICVASVRYWNRTIPIALLKDLSKGMFDTSELEKTFDVSVEPLPFENLDAYCKLYPFFQEKNERIFLVDSDVVWLGDLISVMEQFDEDMIVEGEVFPNYEEVASRWYFNWPELKKQYPAYNYPGFLFNTGQFVMSTSKFSAADFKNIIEWKENTRPEKDNVFLCEDQGVINYVVAEKMQMNEVSVRKHHFFIWGWSKDAQTISLEDIRKRKQRPLLIHWFGKKKGLIGFLPRKDILSFFEHYYYRHAPGGKVRMSIERLKRTFSKFNVFLYESSKKVFYSIKSIFAKK